MPIAIRRGSMEEQLAATHSRSDSKPLVTLKLNARMGSNPLIVVPVRADLSRPRCVSQVRQEAVNRLEERTALLGVMAAAAIA